MTIFDKIIVPVDGSQYALDTVRLAVKIALLQGAQLRLLHVLDTFSFLLCNLQGICLDPGCC